MQKIRHNRLLSVSGERGHSIQLLLMQAVHVVQSLETTTLVALLNHFCDVICGCDMIA